MNFYHKSCKAIATFTLVSGLISILAGANSKISVEAQTPEQVQTIAREITVRIDATTPGSGVIIAKQDSTYYVLTARHVVETQEQYNILTYDGRNYPVKATPIIKNFGNADLAVVTFVSDRNYRVATISRYLKQTYERRSYDNGKIFSGQTENQQQVIFVSGFPNPIVESDPPHRYVFNPGRIVDTSGSAISEPSKRAKGYRLSYSNFTRIGMSGGAVLDANGRLIGIHGRADGQKIADDQIVPGNLNEARKDFRVSFGNSLGMPITTFLTLLPNTGLQIDLKIENTPPNSISTSQLKSWTPSENNNDLRTNAFYWINYGNQSWRLGNLSEAQKAFDQAISITDNLTNDNSEKLLARRQAFYAKGFVAGFNRNFAEALTNCQESITLERETNFYEAWRCKAGALYRLGDSNRLPDALKALERSIEINKESRLRLPPQLLGEWRENPTDYTERGEILFALGRKNEALMSFDKAIEVAKPDEIVSAWVSRAFVQIDTQDFNGAEASINKALAIDANYSPAWANKGLLLNKRRLYLESLAAFDTAVKLNNRDPEIWNNRAVTLFYLGKKESAIESARKALEIDRNYAPATEVIRQIERSQSK